MHSGDTQPRLSRMLRPRKIRSFVVAIALAGGVLVPLADQAQPAEALVISSSGMEGLSEAPRSPNGFETFNDVLYFSARVDGGDYALWSFDGTDFTVVSSTTISPRALTLFQDKLFFVAEESSGYFLYSYDGTTVAQEAPAGSEVQDMAVFDGKLYLRGNGSTNNLVAYDGVNAPVATPGATVDYPLYFATVGDKLVFSAWYSGDRDFFAFDGVNTPEQITFGDGGPRSSVLVDGVLYFVVSNGAPSYSGSLFSFDGFNPASLVETGLDVKRDLLSVEGTLYFMATDSDNTGNFYRWRAGVATPIAGAPEYSSDYTFFRGSIFFSANNALNEFDGTTFVDFVGPEEPDQSIVFGNSLIIPSDGTPSLYRYTADAVAEDLPTTEDSAPTLAATGFEAAHVLGASALLLLLGVTFLAVPTLRRKHELLAMHAK